MQNQFGLLKKNFTPFVTRSFKLYHDRVIDHYENPRNVGSLDKKDKKVGTGLVGAPACGDAMQMQIEMDENGKTIKRAVFKVQR